MDLNEQKVTAGTNLRDISHYERMGGSIVKFMDYISEDNNVDTSSYLKLPVNCIQQEELQNIILSMTQTISDIVSKTYGPFGHNVLLPSGTGSICSTKDGWTVEQSIGFNKNMLLSSLRRLILNVSQSIVSHAGDGTTTGMIVANELNKRLIPYIKQNKIHTKLLQQTLTTVVNDICSELRNHATQITPENLEETIYNIAMVSTNWDTEMSSYIRDIYVKTGNPIIKVQDSGLDHSYVSYIDGFDLRARLLLPSFHINNHTNQSFTAENPAILMFSYAISEKLLEPLLVAASSYQMQGRGLIVLAPDYETGFKDGLVSVCTNAIRSHIIMPALVPVVYRTDFNIEREMLSDLSFLINAEIISKDNPTTEPILLQYTNIMRELPPTRLPDETEESFNARKMVWAEDKKDAINTVNEHLLQHFGTCGLITVDDKTVLVSQLNNINLEELEHRKKLISSEIDKKLKEMTAKSMFNDELTLKRLRLGKLQLNMGVINVGGFGDVNLSGKRAALDDAIHACENAFKDGVVEGCGMAVPIVLSTMTKIDEQHAPSTLKSDLANILFQSFIQSTVIMFNNKYDDMTKSKGKVFDMLEHGIPYNIITEKYDTSIIHPVNVDIEILKGCLHLVMTTLSASQMLYTDNCGMDEDLEKLYGIKEVKPKGV